MHSCKAIQHQVFRRALAQPCFLFFWIFLLICFFQVQVFSQAYYVVGGPVGFKFDMDAYCTAPCNPIEFSLINPSVYGGISFGPDGLLYGIAGPSPFNRIIEINTTNAQTTLIYTGPPNLPLMDGFIAMGGGIFYSMYDGSDSLYLWDVNSNSVSVVGATGYNLWGEMCLSNGNAYYLSWDGVNNLVRKVIHLDLVNPSNSSVAVTFPFTYGIFGITASPDPGYLIASDVWNVPDGFGSLSLADGSFNYLCDVSSLYGGFATISSPYEHNTFPPGNPYVDLDCNDSSGAVDADYNAVPFNCLLPGGVEIADDDIIVRSNATISSMSIKIINPIPDAPDEILDLAGALPGIIPLGLGTSMLTLLNGGNATMNDFENALKVVVYDNNSFNITPGMRTVEVKFTTSAGLQSNVARAYINVEDLPNTPLDLGPDIEPCAGETVVLNAGSNSYDYIWSDGETGNEITVTQSGNYSVTVSNGFTCPSRDTVNVDFIPIIHVWLTGDTATCQDDTAQLLITTDALFPISVTVTPDPGDPVTLYNIVGTGHIIDFPFVTTEYTITEVIPSQAACVELPDPDQIVDIWPNYSGSTDQVSLCFGDSILLGNQYYDTAGIFQVMLNSIHGCDSLVQYTISLLLTEHLFFSSTTCDPSISGIYYSFLPNANGCDTVVQTTVNLLPTDTTLLTTFSCRISESGLVIDTLTNQFGCDSLIATTVAYIPPVDTTEVIQYTCDSAQVSAFFTLATSSNGCDSLIHTQVVIPAPDTTMISFSSCDTSSVGVIQTWYNGIDGCDSLVIQTTSLTTNDTTLVSTTSCDSADLGIFVSVFPIANSCDSVVITTVNFSLADTTLLSSNTCDPGSTGVYNTSFINQFGCDSFVIQTLSLLPSDQRMLAGTSCNPADTGTFITHLFNQFGCDSMITQIISLLPSHVILKQSTTCDQAQAGHDTTLFQNQFGCDSLLVETTVFLEPDTTYQNGFSCNLLDTGTISVHFQNSYGCDSVVIEGTALFPLPTVQVVSGNDFNGYDISCSGASDGIISTAVNGINPFQYSWSQGGMNSNLSGIPAGQYSVTVSDANGCNASSAINLLEPPPLSLQLMVSEPDCFIEGFGIIIVTPSGGIPPYQYSNDQVLFAAENTFENLTEGIYTISTMDANGCETSEIIAIHIPVPVNVDLGENQVVDIGDTTIISAMVNVPSSTLDSIAWYGLDSIACPNCLQQTVIPFITTAYSIEVINDDGCRDQDEVTDTVVRNGDIFVPNIFSPNGDGINDVLQIYAGAFVESIERFNIFDRWGNLVFTASHFDPRQEQFSWDGTFKSKSLNPAVYAFQLVAKLKDGSQIIRHGDITLIR